jgi:hypothetical protein
MIWASSGVKEAQKRVDFLGTNVGTPADTGSRNSLLVRRLQERRAGLRIQSRKGWEFDSPLAHSSLQFDPS